MNLNSCKTTQDLIQEIDNQIKILTNKRDEIANCSNNAKFETIGEFIQRVRKAPKLEFYKTNLSWLDSILYNGGIAEGSFINIAGASFAGKTTLTINLLKGLAQQNKVAFFSFEMYERILINKFSFSKMNVLENMLIIQDNTHIDSIINRIKILNNQGVKIIAIDSRMKITADPKLSEYEKNSLISSKLSELTRTLGVVIVLINQISEIDLKTGRFSLKGSGDQFYDSDMVWFLFRKKDKDGIEGEERYLNIAKDRIGEQSKTIQMPFYIRNEPEIKTFNEGLE